jgi:hypothetical protein
MIMILHTHTSVARICILDQGKPIIAEVNIQCDDSKRLALSRACHRRWVLGVSNFRACCGRGGNKNG